jgi:hypothetical protein
MTLNHRVLVTCCFAILSLVAALGSTSAAPTKQSSVTQHRHHGAQMPHRHSLYNYYTRPGVVARPGCYLPSDGCDSEYSVQN